MTATGTCQLTMDDEGYGINSQLAIILAVSYSYPDSWAHAGTEAKYEVRFSTAVARAIPVRWL